MVYRARRTSVGLMIAVCSCWIAIPALAESLSSALGGSILPEWEFEEARQYDFWIGEWRANWRSRPEGEILHQDEGTWARHWLFTVLDGKALIEIVRGEEPNASGAYTQGFSIRYWDSSKERWVMAQNWPPPNSGYAFLDQLQGFKHHGRVEVFSGVTDAEGNPQVRRYTFSDIAPDRLRWDSATTDDSGSTWTAGTIAEFHRTAAVATLPEVGASLPDSPDGTHCQDPGFKRFDFLEGRWEGKAETVREGVVPATLVATRFQNGCSVLSLLQYPRQGAPFKLLQATTYGSRNQMWFALQLDNRSDSPHRYRLGGEDDAGRIVLNANPELTIADDFKPPAWMGDVVPENPAGRTVWTEMSEDRIVFEHQALAPSGDWVTKATFELAKRPD